MKRLLFLTFLLLAQPLFAADPAVPSAGVTNWTPGTYTGVPGGIPTDRTEYVNAITGALGGGGTYGGTLAVGDGVTDDTAAIQAMLVACPEGKFVYLPVGYTYKVTTINISGDGSKKNVTLRGGGPTTILNGGESYAAISIGPTNSFVTPEGFTESQLMPTAGLTRGSTQLTLPTGGTDALSVGQLVRVSQDIDETVPHFSVFAYRYLAGQNVRVTSKTSTTFDFFPPLYDDYGAGSIDVKLGVAAAKVSGIGIENLHIVKAASDAGANGINLNQAYGCWIKDVSFESVHNYPIKINDSLQVEVRRNTIMPRYGSGTSGAGILVEATSGALVEDNIVYDNWIASMMVNFGASGNAFSRNFTTGPNMWFTNHAPHNQLNVYEGNVTEGFKSDGYFGGERWALFFANKTRFISAYRFSRDFSAVGNFVTGTGSYLGRPGDLGMPFFGNGSYSVGTSTWYAANYTDDWAERLITGTVTAHTKGTGTGYQVNHSGGYAEGTTSIELDSGTGTILAGDVVKFTGSPLRYNVVSFVGTTLTISANSYGSTGLVGTLADNTAVTVTTDKLTISYTGSNSPQLRGRAGPADVMVIAATWNSYANHQLYLVETESAGVITTSSNSNGADPCRNDPPDIGTSIVIGAGQDQSVLDEKDLGVEATLFLAGNRYTQTGELDSMAGATLPQSYIYSAKPQWLTDAETEHSTTFNFRPFDAVSNTSPGDSDIPAGYRYTYTLPPAFASASINPPGTELSVTANKPMFVGAGGSPSASLSGGVTATFNRIEGSTIIFTPSRTISEGETLTVTLTNATNGYEDVNGNDLPNITAQTVSNASYATTGVLHFGPDVVNMTTDAAYGDSSFTLLQKVTATANGTAVAVRFYMKTNVDNAAFRAVVTDAAGLILGGSVTNGSLSGVDRWMSIPISSFSVANGSVYHVGLQFLANGDPTLRSLPGQAAGSSHLHETTAFFSTYPSSLTLGNASTTEYAIQLRVSPDPVVAFPNYATRRGGVRRR